MKGKVINKINLNIFAVRDIIRLNLKNYISRLGDPYFKTRLLTSEGKSKRIEVPRVYYIDLVLNYSQKDQSGQMQHIALDCRRLIVIKEGLVRLES